MKSIINLLIIVLSNTIITSAYSQKRQFNNIELKIIAESNAQHKRARTLTDKALTIGENVPNFEINKIFNYPEGKAKFSDFKGKYIFLDFWARNCASCIGGFPKMERLQQKYGGKIQILAVCTMQTLDVYNLFEPGFPKKSTAPIITKTTLPLIFNCCELVDFFPHTSEPYLVVINPEGKIVAMTDGHNFNESSIETLLANGNIDLPLSKSFSNLLDPSSEYDTTVRSILCEGKGRNINKIVYMRRSKKNPECYGLIAKLGSNMHINSALITDSISGKTIGYVSHKNTLLQLFRRLYPGIEDQFIRIESPNLDKYFYPLDPIERGKWAIENYYSIEVFGQTEKDRELMYGQVLKDYFDNINVVKENSKMKCMILQRTSDQNKLETKFPTHKFDPKGSFSASLFSLVNCPFSFFVEKLKSYNSLNRHNPIPLIDETGYTGNIDLELTNPNKLKEVNLQLSKYDLKFVEEERIVEVLVIKEKQQ